MPQNEMKPSTDVDEQVAISLQDQSDFPSSIPPPPLMTLPSDVPAQSVSDLSVETRIQWNWGAFFFLPCWLFAMKLWKHFSLYLGLVVFCIVITAIIPELKILTNLLLFMCGMWYARYGNRLAWHSSRKWASESQFVATQRLWNYWSVGIILGGLLIIITVFALHA